MDLDALDHWFTTQVLPHEAALTRYLDRIRPRHVDVHDLVQETYARVYERAKHARPIATRPFLFTVGRHLVLDHMRRDRVVSFEATQDAQLLGVLVDEVDPERELLAQDELACLIRALDSLPDATRAVIWLRRVEGLSQRDTAARLQMPEGTVESHLCRGVRALARALFGPTQASTTPARADHKVRVRT